MDSKSSAVVGKLLIDEKDENLVADKSTYLRLVKMAGGILIFGMLIFSTVFFQYYDLYQSKVT